MDSACWFRGKDRSVRDQVPEVLRISYLEHKTNDCARSKINFLVDPPETSSGNYREAETRMVRACHAPQQPLQNRPSRHVGGWARPWSAEKMLDGRHQRVNIPAHARTAHKGLLRRRLEADLLLNRLPCPPDNLIGQGTDWCRLNCFAPMWPSKSIGL